MTVDLAAELAEYDGSAGGRPRPAPTVAGWEDGPLSDYARAKMERRRAKHQRLDDGSCSYCGEPWPCPKLARLPDLEAMEAAERAAEK